MGRQNEQRREPIPKELNDVSGAIVDAAFRVHSTLGPGLLESVYEVCLEHELKKRGLEVKRQLLLPVVYEGVRLDAGLRLDMLVEDCVIVELKAVEQMGPVFDAQLLTYLKLTELRLGLLINFNVPVIKDGIKRVVL
ncbi:GxxExxY protein [candidate division BRC1 bacterium SM23_51]|nr:MAG: GxxExxY protein [candidate division BRC1 bacterium SM23_51]